MFSWHASCYEEYTSKINLERILQTRGHAKDDIKRNDVSYKSLNDQQNPEKILRSSVAPFNWDLCIFAKIYRKIKVKVFVKLKQ